MATATATLKGYRMAPRKMRVVANAIKGKKAVEILSQLDFIAKRGAAPLKKLIQSAIANAKVASMDVDNLFLKTIKVDSGSILYRRLPRAHGTATPLRKRTSQVFVELEEKEAKKAKKTKKTK